MRGKMAVVLCAALVPARPGHGPMAPQEVVAAANDNRTAAGSRSGDTLRIRLTLVAVAWRLHGDADRGFRVAAFAEEGKQPMVPAPLIRVPVGTTVHAVVRNPLSDTLVMRGLSERGGVLDSLVIAPGDVQDVRFVARRIGTYQYWGALSGPQARVPVAVRDNGLIRPGFDSQLAGAFIVDPVGRVADDRVLVITELGDVPPGSRTTRHGVPAREFTAINGRSWPHTERLQYAVGDTVRWRIINTTFQAHPMHLHGFYFRVDSRGSAVTGADTLYAPGARRMAVTEGIGVTQNVSISWVPERTGGWIFHCHLTNHAVQMPPVDRQDLREYPEGHDHGTPDDHVLTGMNGLVLGMMVTGREPLAAAWRPTREVRLYVQSDSSAADSVRRFGYVVQQGAVPARDSIERPGPVLILTRGAPTSIAVINRSGEPTAVHWHGIELESFYDGAVGWSGPDGGKKAPAIRPESTFMVRITPKRAGTFMYHTHFSEMRQQFGGLVGALLVLEPGERWDPARDLLFLVSQDHSGSLLVNGATDPSARTLRAGAKYRIRIADIAPYRQNLIARLTRDSALLSWRPVAKDGFALPSAQATMQPAIAPVASGETADFEFTPSGAGEVRLELGPRTRAGVFQLQGLVRLRIDERE